jgi:hypothetical protein
MSGAEDMTIGKEEFEQALREGAMPQDVEPEEELRALRQWADAEGVDFEAFADFVKAEYRDMADQQEMPSPMSMWLRGFDIGFRIGKIAERTEHDVDKRAIDAAAEAAADEVRVAMGDRLPKDAVEAVAELVHERVHIAALEIEKKRAFLAAEDKVTE